MNTTLYMVAVLEDLEGSSMWLWAAPLASALLSPLPPVSSGCQSRSKGGWGCAGYTSAETAMNKDKRSHMQARNKDTRSYMQTRNKGMRNL